MLQKYCIALEDIVYWAQLSARAAPRRTGPDAGQDKMLREGKIMVTSLYQSLCNMETIYADHVAIRYYDEAKQGVAEVGQVGDADQRWRWESRYWLGDRPVKALNWRLKALWSV